MEQSFPFFSVKAEDIFENAVKIDVLPEREKTIVTRKQSLITPDVMHLSKNEKTRSISNQFNNHV